MNIIFLDNIFSCLANLMSAQIKVFHRKPKVTTLVRSFIKVNAQPSFA